MRRTLFLAVLSLTAGCAFADESDTLKTYRLQEVQVTSTRAGRKTPVAFTNLSKKYLSTLDFGKDMPALLSLTPSVTTSSDAGIGIGYSDLRVRGTDPTRINITANGIPLNDAESNKVYWVNMGDFASTLGSVQLQRGVGTSTNGSGAFGATLNMQTESIAELPYVQLDASGGSYATHRESLRFGTGRLNGHWGLDGRLSNIGSQGYIDRAGSRLNSYFLQGGYFSDQTVVKLVTFNGTERTYHAWDYATEEQMKKYGRRYNPCGKYKDAAGNTVYYKDQIDNYHQQHYQLFWNQLLNDAWDFNLALHYTHGKGYYEQYKTNQKLYKYLLQPRSGSKSDLIRRKYSAADFYGTVFSANYHADRLTANLGGGWNNYKGDHYGRVLWVAEFDGKQQPNHPYYDNQADKKDFNVYAKANFELLKGLNLYGDLQYRYVKYNIDGPSDQFDAAKQQVAYNVHETFNFFNPKAGLSWTIAPRHTAYLSYAMAHKEPTRNDYENVLQNSSKPRHETLNDFELGYNFSGERLSFGVNFYYMRYKDQFVLTGEQNAIGEMISKNVGDSYRRGVELQAAWRPFDFLRWDANLTWSHNREKNTLVQMNDTGETVNLGNTPLSFSPNLIFNNVFTAEYRGFRASLQTQYVSRQLMTRTGFTQFEEDGHIVHTSIDPYLVSNLDCSYTFSRLKAFKALTVGFTIYNLMNAKYESNGAANVVLKKDAAGKVIAYQDSDYNAYSVFSAQAPLHFLAHISIRF